MSVPSYSFNSLSLKLPNKGMSFSFPQLKLPNNERESKNILNLLFSFLSIPFSQMRPKCFTVNFFIIKVE